MSLASTPIETKESLRPAPATNRPTLPYNSSQTQGRCFETCLRLKNIQTLLRCLKKHIILCTFKQSLLELLENTEISRFHLGGTLSGITYISLLVVQDT